MHHHARGVRPLVAPLVVVLAAALGLTACSGSSSTPVAQPTAPASTQATQPQGAVNHDAAALVALAARATAAQRAYSFVADERIEAGTLVRTHLSGRLVRGQGVAYTLDVGGRRTQVVRLPDATFARTVPGNWSRLAKPRRLVDPTSTLLGLLRHMTATGLSRQGATRVVTGQLPVADAGAAGLPQLAAPAHVVVAISRGGDVVGVALRADTTVNGKNVAIVLQTRYSDFGHVAPIRRPI